MRWHYLSTRNRTPSCCAMQAGRRAIRVTWRMCCGIGSGALAPAAWCPRGRRAVVSAAVLLRPLRRISFRRGSCRSNEIIVLGEKSAILRLYLCWNAALFCSPDFPHETMSLDRVSFLFCNGFCLWCGGSWAGPPVGNRVTRGCLVVPVCCSRWMHR